MGVVYDSVTDQNLVENFTNMFRPGYITIKGVTMPERFKDFYETIENWDVYDDDVWICSFPKTGTTWTQEMIWMIMNNLDFVDGQRSLGERYPFLDHTILFDYREFLKNNNGFNPPDYFEDSITYVREQKRPRLIKTHLPWNLLPRQIQNGTKTPKIIYVARNPKDTCVSYFHHCRLIEGFKGCFEDFCRLFFSGKLCYAPFWENVLQFWERREQSNILFLKYEDLKRNLPNAIRQVADFLDNRMNEGQVKLLTEHLSFDSMKNNRAVNYEPFLEMSKKHKLIDENGCFMRSGTVGGYKKEMTPELIEIFDLWIKEHAPNNGLGY